MIAYTLPWVRVLFEGWGCHYVGYSLRVEAATICLGDIFKAGVETTSATVKELGYLGGIFRVGGIIWQF